MAEQMTRDLLVIRRTVSGDQMAAYDRAWVDLSRGVEVSGAHAWRFRSRSNTADFTEFLEFKKDRDPRTEAAVQQALRRLDEIARGIVEELVDAPPSTPDH